MHRGSGRAETPAADREVTRHLVEQTARSGEAGLRVWMPHRSVAFGRRDTHRSGYDMAREAARTAGYPPVERSVGGHAVAFSGRTVAFVRTEPVDNARSGIQHRYERILSLLADVLAAMGVTVERSEPSGAFCPGSHSLSAGGKLLGLGQRVRSDVATVAGVVLVDDHEAVAAVLDPVYDHLGLDFSTEAVGSLQGAGAEVSPVAVRERIESALATAAPDPAPVRET